MPTSPSLTVPKYLSLTVARSAILTVPKNFVLGWKPFSIPWGILLHRGCLLYLGKIWLCRNLLSEYLDPRYNMGLEKDLHAQNTSLGCIRLSDRYSLSQYMWVFYPLPQTDQFTLLILLGALWNENDVLLKQDSLVQHGRVPGASWYTDQKTKNATMTGLRMRPIPNWIRMYIFPLTHLSLSQALYFKWWEYIKKNRYCISETPLG